VERTLVLLKPDAVQRRLIGEIISRIEKICLKVVGIKMIHIDQDLAHKHYSAHVGKPFFESLVDFITSSPVVAIVFEGDNAVDQVRSMMGVTNPAEAEPGTIRGDLASSIEFNLIHGSDSIESAENEVKLFFSAGELMDYSLDVDKWVIES